MIYGLFFFKLRFSGFFAKKYPILAKIIYAAALLLALITFFWVLKKIDLLRRLAVNYPLMLRTWLCNTLILNKLFFSYLSTHKKM